MDWVERMFIPVPYCNTYSLHQVPGAPGTGVMCVTLFGHAHWLDDRITSNLRELLNETLDEGCSIELVASDCATYSDGDVLAFLATW
ncbi:unnamed protein product [Anisakis simplex]|uniref:Transposase n=1 Tax=Anisakis simplex TaxID=6269 RepID=A0A0M3JAL2_ANISI|nr:unnamed protein product [Anisakis simplex]